MVTFREFISEASTPGRAWSGKLKNIDELLSWMYDKDILSKSEKAAKDSIFRQYYRWYNDGDLPRGFGGFKDRSGRVSVSKYREKEIEAHIESKVEEFIRKILSKYLGKIDKQEFYYDKHISELQTIVNVADRYDVHGLTKYWIKNSRDENLTSMIKELESDYDSLTKEFNEFLSTIDFDKLGVKSYDRPSSNKVIDWSIKKLQELKVSIPSSIMSDWKDVQTDMIEISAFTKNLITGIQKLKTLKALG